MFPPTIIFKYAFIAFCNIFWTNFIFKKIQKLFGPEIYQLKKISSLVLLKKIQNLVKNAKKIFIFG